VQAGKGIGAMVACSWGVMDLKVEFQETKTPPGQTTLGVGKVEDPSQRVVVNTDNKPMSLQIGSEVEDSPQYRQTFLICSRVVALCAREAATLVAVVRNTHTCPEHSIALLSFIAGLP
jgi:hypothetical protein